MPSPFQVPARLEREEARIATVRGGYYELASPGERS
jgi:hypothetical protein